MLHSHKSHNANNRNGPKINLNFHYAKYFSFDFRVKYESDMILAGLEGFVH